MLNYESPEEEVARLDSAEEGSINHTLSQLPVTIDQWPQDMLIRLPRYDRRIVVVPVQYRGPATPRSPRRRHDGAWECAVVESDHPDYPVGGHRIAVTAAEIVRGTRVSTEGGETETSNATVVETLDRIGFFTTDQDDGEPIIVHQETGAFVLGWATKDWVFLVVENESYTFTVDQLDRFPQQFWIIHGMLDEYTAKYL